MEAFPYEILHKTFKTKVCRKQNYISSKLRLIILIYCIHTNYIKYVDTSNENSLFT